MDGGNSARPGWLSPLAGRLLVTGLIAEREVGADPGRWVNGSVLLDEYNDYLERGRPLGPWPPT